MLSLLAATPATAQPQDAATSPCPAGYWQMESALPRQQHRRRPACGCRRAVRRRLALPL